MNDVIKGTFNGLVEKKLINIGSRSEHEGVLLTTDEGNIFELRIKGHNPFSDPELDAFAGQKVSVEGDAYRGLLFVDDAAKITVQKSPDCKIPRPPQPKL